MPNFFSPLPKELAIEILMRVPAKDLVQQCRRIDKTQDTYALIALFNRTDAEAAPYQINMLCVLLAQPERLTYYLQQETKTLLLRVLESFTKSPYICQNDRLVALITLSKVRKAPLALSESLEGMLIKSAEGLDKFSKMANFAFHTAMAPLLNEEGRRRLMYEIFENIENPNDSPLRFKLLRELYAHSEPALRVICLTKLRNMLSRDPSLPVYQEACRCIQNLTLLLNKEELASQEVKNMLAMLPSRLTADFPKAAKPAHIPQSVLQAKCLQLGKLPKKEGVQYVDTLIKTEWTHAKQIYEAIGEYAHLFDETIVEVLIEWLTKNDSLTDESAGLLATLIACLPSKARDKHLKTLNTYLNIGYPTIIYSAACKCLIEILPSLNAPQVKMFLPILREKIDYSLMGMREDAYRVLMYVLLRLSLEKNADIPEDLLKKCLDRAWFMKMQYEMCLVIQRVVANLSPGVASDGMSFLKKLLEDTAFVEIAAAAMISLLPFLGKTEIQQILEKRYASIGAIGQMLMQRSVSLDDEQLSHLQDQLIDVFSQSTNASARSIIAEVVGFLIVNERWDNQKPLPESEEATRLRYLAALLRLKASPSSEHTSEQSVIGLS